jgi:hypothetical protein
LIITILASTGYSKNEKDNSVVTVPDPAFKAWLPGYYDTNENGEISFSETKGIIQIILDNNGIINLFRIERHYYEQIFKDYFTVILYRIKIRLL